MPLAALIFYIATYILWNAHLIPPPSQVLLFLEDLYRAYGLFGVFIASFLEGLVYLGLYFPGSTIIAVSVFLTSTWGFWSLFYLVLIVAAALTVASILNYWFGRYLVYKHMKKQKRKHESDARITKGLLVSILHPNLLSFYTFNAGLEKQKFKKMLYIPVLMVPYGLVFAYFLVALSKPIKDNLDNPWFFLSLILLWMGVAFILEQNSKKKK